MLKEQHRFFRSVFMATDLALIVAEMSCVALGLTAAIKMAKAIGCTVYTTVGDDEKGEKVKALGADHVINYRKERFEGEVRRLTKRQGKGVDVVFEHVGAETWNGSLLCLKRGGRLVTCGSTSGVSVIRAY